LRSSVGTTSARLLEQLGGLPPPVAAVFRRNCRADSRRRMSPELLSSLTVVLALVCSIVCFVTWLDERE
jgi:hypothetical protein